MSLGAHSQYRRLSAKRASCATRADARYLASTVDTRTVKVCPCCGQTLTWQQWALLPGGEIMSDDEGSAIELRHCRCGSTIGLPYAKSTLDQPRVRPEPNRLIGVHK